MATAALYDKYEDPGLAFTHEELADWDMRKWTEERVARLLGFYRILERRFAQPGMEKKEWHHESAKWLLNVANWYCRTMELPGLTEADRALPAPDTAVGRELSSLALGFNVENWLKAEHESLVSELRRLVTIGRRCAGVGARIGWGKDARSLSNKLANAVLKEISTYEKIGKKYSSTPVADPLSTTKRGRKTKKERLEEQYGPLPHIEK